MKKEIIGIDVSKSTIDVWLHHAKDHKIFTNNESGFKKMMKWIIQLTQLTSSDVSFCLEHTGLYSIPLCMFLSSSEVSYYLVSGLLVKRSLGLVRGKNDKADAQNLARFAFLHGHELQPYKMPCDAIMQLKQLHSFRARLVKQCSGYKVHLREMKYVLKGKSNNIIVNQSIEMVETFEKKIKTVEKEMRDLINSDESINTTFKQITGIKGVGLILAATVIVSTNNFQSFETWRKFACYAGIAPFEHRSGSSYKGKTRISSLGNRELKTLLSQAAATAIQYNPEMKIYYEKRVAEGKSKMSTLNIIRNKIVSRIFAVARRQAPFVETFKFAA